MVKRITIVLADKTVKDVKKIQAKLLLEAEGSVSFSSVIDMLLKEVLAK